MTAGRVSTVIPCYNCLATLARAIDSALIQGYRDLEVIVVDDASTEDVSQLVCGYREAVHWFRLARNGGPSVARNVGVANSSGEFIAFLDADDEWLPDHLSRQVELMNRFLEAGFCFCNAWNRDFNSHDIDLFQHHDSLIAQLDRDQVDADAYLVHRYLDAAILQSNFIATSAVMVRRSFWDCVGGFDERLRGPEDMHLWIRMARRAPALMVRTVGEVRHQRQGGLTMQGAGWYAEFLKGLDLIALEVGGDPSVMGWLRRRRRDTYFSLILCHGRDWELRVASASVRRPEKSSWHVQVVLSRSY